MDDFIGKGWSFPPNFNKAAQSVEMVSDEAEIEGSLAVLFSTQVGERLFRPTFGCNLNDYLFRNNSEVVILRMKNMIAQAIEEFEPRITLDSVNVNMDEIIDGKLSISLLYTINATNRKYNMVYPYYLENA